MTTSSRPQRKRKQAAVFTPISRHEERSLKQAIRTSLRPIPLNDSESEDEVTSGDEDFDEEAEDEDLIDEESEEDEYERKWSKKVTQISVTDFTELSGATKVLSSQQNVKSFFELLFNKKVLHIICSQTNIYAEQPAWKPLLPGELKAWIGCLLAMGLNKKPNLQMYWDSVWKFSLVADRFTRDRFFAIQKYLHLADNSTITGSKVIQC